MNRKILKTITPYLLILPFVLIMLFIFLGGISQAILQSLGYLPVFGMDEITLSHYLQVFANSRFRSSLGYTIYIAFTSASLSVIFGVAIAFLVHDTKRGEKLAYTLYKTPIIIPHVVVVILIIQIFSQSGIISRGLFALGLLENALDFPLFINDRAGIGIILTYLYKQIPFVTLVVFTVLKKLNNTYVKIAQNLGASQFQILKQVLSPLLAPSILSSFLITFAFAFGAFEVPFLLGSPARVTLPILAYTDFRSPVLASRPTAMATSIVIAVIALGLILIYLRLFKRLTKQDLEGEII